MMEGSRQVDIHIDSSLYNRKFNDLDFNYYDGLVQISQLKTNSTELKNFDNSIYLDAIQINAIKMITARDVITV